MLHSMRQSCAVSPLPNLRVLPWQGVSILYCSFSKQPRQYPSSWQSTSPFKIFNFVSTMQLGAAFLAFGLASLLVNPITLTHAQVGPDGYTTVATATCTATGLNIYAYTDASSVGYNYMCGGGSGGTAFSTVASASVSRWQDCYAYCDNYVGTTSNCTGFSYVSSASPSRLLPLDNFLPHDNFSIQSIVTCLFDPSAIFRTAVACMA